MNTLHMLSLSLASERALRFLRENEHERRALTLSVKYQRIATATSDLLGHSHPISRKLFGDFCKAEDLLFVKFLEWEDKHG